MALHLHRAERTDLLADGLGALLSDPLPDPFADELVAWSTRLPQLALLGACCGSTPAWISALVDRLHPDPDARVDAFARLAALVPRAPR
jgi:hypothetical protein